MLRRRFIGTLSTLLLGMCTHARAQTSPPPAAAKMPTTVAARVTAPRLCSYPELAKTDFFQFFHVHEVSRTKDANGATHVHLKTGGFQESVDIEITIDVHRDVNAAELRLARTWVGDAAHMNPFATDIAASYLATFAPEPDRAQLKFFADGIRALHGTRDHVVSLHAPSADAKAPPDVAELLDTLTGAQTSFELPLRAATLRATNGSQGLLSFAMVAKSWVPAASGDAMAAAAKKLEGMTLLGQAHLMQALTGESPMVLINAAYLALEPQLAKNALPADELLRVVQLIANVDDPERTAVQIMVYDGNSAHAINVTTTDTDMSVTTYWDPWGQGSFLQANNNQAGVDVVQSPDNPRFWRIASKDLARVLYGALLDPKQARKLTELVESLEKPEAAIQNALALQKSERAAHLANAASWLRLSTLLALQGRTALAAAARRVADALSANARKTSPPAHETVSR